VKVGHFDIPGDQAREFLQMPLNPNGRPNAEVVKPWANGMDIVRRPSDTWIIDFGNLTTCTVMSSRSGIRIVIVNGGNIGGDLDGAAAIYGRRLNPGSPRIFRVIR
jgi:hypothetical protein